MQTSPKKRSNEESGFTLVELLVVILIIGVLAAIAIPAFMNQRQKANTATLETDLRNTATAYHTWLSVPGNNNAKYWEISNGVRATYIQHPDAENKAPNGIKRWHNTPELPNSPVSEGTIIELIVNNAVSSGWNRNHEEGEFCMIASAPNSEYDYIPYGGMGAAHFDRLLYFDAKLGGIATMDDLLVAYDEGKDFSCEGHRQRYAETRGL